MTDSEEAKPALAGWVCLIKEGEFEGLDEPRLDEVAPGDCRGLIEARPF